MLDGSPDGKRTLVQQFDAEGNERKAHNCFYGENQRKEESAGDCIFYENDGQCCNREIEDGGCAQENASVGGVEGYGPGQEFAEG